jgi:hypothetical protein
MMGTQSAPVPPLSQSSSVDRDMHSAAPANFVNSQSVMSMSSSASEQFVSAMAEDSGPDRKGTHNRSVSEPDFKRQQVESYFSTVRQIIFIILLHHILCLFEFADV